MPGAGFRRIFLYALTGIAFSLLLVGWKQDKNYVAVPVRADNVYASYASSTFPRPTPQPNQWHSPTQRANRQALIRAIDLSLRYLQTGRAAAAYNRIEGKTGITRTRVRRSLIRFRQLLKTSRSLAQLEAALQREFVCYQSVGQNNDGQVHFTGYYEPIYRASRVRTATFRYPIYRLPARFRSWPRPHPPRVQLEGVDGLHPAPYLRGLELAWLKDRLEAYLVQVEGSARLRFPDGRMLSVGYAGHTDYSYTSLGRELVNDGKIPFASLTQQALIQYFRAHPAELSQYIPRNRRFVFFRERRGAPATGSIGAPLTAEHSIATDKSLMPPAALALIQVKLQNPYAVRVLKTQKMTRFVLDQDTGGAIKGPGRVDIFMGTGQQAGERAGVMNSMGHLRYVLLKEGTATSRGGRAASPNRYLVPVPFPDL